MEQPPPPNSSTERMLPVEPSEESERRRTLRVIGFVTALSTPISAFVSFALVAIIFGEDRLEGADGLTGLGVVSMLLPVLAGALLILWSWSPLPVPSTKNAAKLLGGLGIVVVGVGIYSTVTSAETRDPSIGGGLLVLIGFVLTVASAVLLWDRGATED